MHVHLLFYFIFIEHFSSLLLFCFYQSGLVDAVVNNVNTTAFLSYAESILSQYSISSASFESVNIDVALILKSVFAVQSVFFLFDYIYRVYQTVHLVSRFWRRGVVRLPKVDLRSKNIDVSGPWFKYLGCLLQVLPFFSLQLMLLAAFIIILIWGFAGKIKHYCHNLRSLTIF